MKKTLSLLNPRWFFILFICLVSPQWLSALSIDKLYISMPDSVHSTVSQNTRMELVEYYKAGSSDSILNRFNNKITILALDTMNNNIRIQSTKSTLFEMKLMDCQSAPIIAVIHTVCSPICHSNVQFYDTAWAPIPLVFDTPKSIKWLDRDSLQNTNLDVQWVQNLLQDSFVSLTFDSISNDIIAFNNVLDFISDDTREVIEGLMVKQPIRYQLEGKRWVMKK